MIQPRFPDVTVRIIGLDYDLSAIYQRVSRALEESGHGDHVKEFQRDWAKNSANTIRLFLTVQEWVDIT